MLRCGVDVSGCAAYCRLQSVRQDRHDLLNLNYFEENGSVAFAPQLQLLST